MTESLHLPAPGLPRVPRYTGVADHLVDALDQLNPLSVLRGPRGFGKTSALVAWLRRGAALPEAVYLTLTPEAGDPAGFWVQLRRGLAHVDPELGAGLEEPQADHEHAVVTWLGRRRTPLLLIIDDYHEAGLREGAAGIDDALVDLISQNDRLYLVVAGRTVRALETIGSLSVETLIIGPEELQLTPPMVQALAAEMGVDLSSSRALKVANDLGGWPSAIRAGLQRAATGSPYGTGEVTLGGDYIAAMVRDLRFESVRTFLLRTSIPEEIDVDTARVIAPEGNTVRMLRNIRAAGLLRETDANSGTYYYPRAVRMALQNVLRETRPDAEQEVYQDLMGAALTRNEPAVALRYATKGKLWGLALDVLDTHWSYLLSTSPATLGEAASAFPAQMVPENPRLSVARRYLQGIRTDSGEPTWAGVDSASLNAALAVHRSGRDDPGQDELLLLLQWGAASLLRGNLDMAMYAFSQARACALLNDAGDETYLGAAGIALVHALQGEVDQCLAWLEEPSLATWLSRDDGLSGRDPMLLVARAARALALVDGARPGAEEAVAALEDPQYRDELWALCVFIRARHAIAVAQPAEVVRQTTILRTALRHIRQGSLLEALLTIELVDALLSSAMTVVAAEVVQRLEPRGFTWMAVAKLRLEQERFAEANEAADAVLASSGESGRYVLDAHAIRAAAQRAIGRLRSARSACRSAVRRAQQTGQRRGIEWMGRGVFLAFCAEDEAARQLWPDSTDSVAEHPEVDTEAVTLTFREAEILQSLTQYSGPMRIAEAMGVSVNTVKTHLRSVYRKLGVSSRNEALEKVQRVVVRT